MAKKSTRKNKKEKDEKKQLIMDEFDYEEIYSQTLHKNDDFYKDVKLYRHPIKY